MATVNRSRGELCWRLLAETSALEVHEHVVSRKGFRCPAQGTETQWLALIQNAKLAIRVRRLWPWPYDLS